MNNHRKGRISGIQTDSDSDEDSIDSALSNTWHQVHDSDWTLSPNSGQVRLKST